MVRKMTHPELESFLATALDLRASDLHIIAGVPPAFRVNGDILFGDPWQETRRLKLFASAFSAH